MRNRLSSIFVLAFIFGLLSCSSNKDEKNDPGAEVLDEMEKTAERNALRTVSAVTVKPDNTYVDLKTQKLVKIRMDTITRNIYDVETKYPIDYVVDPSTSDTIDRTGRIVNKALIIDKDGNWLVDESKMKKIE